MLFSRCFMSSTARLPASTSTPAFLYVNPLSPPCTLPVRLPPSLRPASARLPVPRRGFAGGGGDVACVAWGFRHRRRGNGDCRARHRRVRGAVAAWPRPTAAARLVDAATPRYDRVYKVDLLEQLPSPPELVIFGGSRAQRFEPSFAEKLTGLPAFNFAVQNSRPEDVYAMSRLLFWRAPSVKLRCIWALQATTLSDSPLHPGLLAEPRLTQFLPDYLVAAAAQGVA